MRLLICRYDNHRDQILRGSQTNYEDESLDVFQYFTAACYKGFGDDDNSFYAIYAKVFDQLATEDIEFMDSPDEFEDIPKFGTSMSDYETVVGPFYAYWQSYCTKKTYTWLCPHNITEIRDRRILREIEKETKKLAQKARKERNDEIRALVSFVRKRDKRVQEYKKKLEERAEQNRIKQQQHRLAQLKKNQQEAAAVQTNHQSVFNTSDHEAQLRALEQAYGSDSEYDDYDENDDIENENNEEDGAEELILDDLYCVACNKSFKNISSFENHESSKKHRENIEKLKKQMVQQEQDNLSKSDGEVSDLDLGELDEEFEEEQTEFEIVDAKKKSNRKSKKTKNKAQIVQAQSDEEEAYLELVTKPMTDVNIGLSVISDNDGWSDDAGKKNKKSKTKKANVKSKVKNNVTEPNTSGTEGIAESGSNKKSNKKSTREANSDRSMTYGGCEDGESIDVSHTCVTCQSTFDSKNKLFNHLKKTNHGVYIPKTTSTSNESKRGKRK